MQSDLTIDGGDSKSDVIEDKILYVLDHFPRISPSMLQISMGSGMPTQLWRPVLERLIDEGKVYRMSKTVKNPQGRMETKTILSSEPVTDDDGDGDGIAPTVSE